MVLKFGYDEASNMDWVYQVYTGKVMMEIAIYKENSMVLKVWLLWRMNLLFMLIVLLINFNWHLQLSTFFKIVAIFSNVVGASCKRRDILREKQVKKVT